MKKRLLLMAYAIMGILLQTQAQTYYSENFEGCTIPNLPSTWTTATTGSGAGWQTSNTTITYVGTLRIRAHSKYAVVNECTTPYNNPALGTTPTFSTSGGAHVYLSLDYCFLGLTVTSTGRTENAQIEYSTDGGSSYSYLTSIAADTGWTSMTVALPATSANCKLRFSYRDNRTSTDTIPLMGVGIDNIKVFDALANDLAMTAIRPITGDPATDYAPVGGNMTFGGTVFNNSYNTVSSFNATYRIPSTSTVVTSTISASIAPFTSYNFTISTPYTLTATGLHNADVYVALSGDTSHANDTMHTQFTGTAFTPTKRVFYEDAFGTWCGWNPRSIVYMDSLWSLDSGFVNIAEVHNSDPMQSDNSRTVSYDNYMSSRIGGFPTTIADRDYTGDPSDVFTVFNAKRNNFAFANIAESVSYSSGSLAINCTVTPAINMSGDYRLALVLIENGVHSSASGYEMHNYYSGGGSGAMSFGGLNFATLPSTIPASSMYYRYVSRYTIPDMSSSPNGISGSLPSTMTAGSTYSYSFSSISVGSGWNYANLRAIVLLIDNNSASPTYGQVLNSFSQAVTAPPTISGASTICQGATAAFTASVGGGSWSSSNPSIATVSSSGVVTGVSAGTATISYTTSAGTATATITVNPAPNAGTISGPTSLCPSATTTYTSSVSGGTWISTTPSVATIIGSGFTAALSTGTTFILYTVTNSCGTDTAALFLTVSSTPSAGTITGLGSVCVGTSTTLYDATAGGTWTSSNPSIASINPSTGVVYGVSTGSVTITYAVTLSCGSASTTTTITVNSGPYAGTLSGASTVCTGVTTTLTPSVMGGTWSSSNPSVASVSGGVVTGVATGTATISYTVNNGCGAATVTQAMTVNLTPYAGSISGADSICVGDTVVLTDTVTGGAWSSSAGSVATVNGSGRVIALSAGATTISYTVTSACGSATATHYIVVNTDAYCHMAVPETSKTASTLVVYPNPGNGLFNIELDGVSGTYHVIVLDVYGRTVINQTGSATNGLSAKLNLSSFAAGSYFIRVEAAGEHYVEKIVKQ